MQVRFIEANAQHAAEMVDLTIASITQLCFDDHGNDPILLAEWTDNKTVPLMQQWIAKPDIYVVVGFISKQMVAAGGVSSEGRILRNYVLPEQRFKGYSKALMGVLETYLLDNGLKEATLESSKTAVRFYQNLDWFIVNTDDGKVEMMKYLGA